MKLSEKTQLFGHFLFNLVKAGDTTIIMQSIDGNTGCINGPANAVQLPIEDCKLVLRPITAISRKEAMECAELSNLPESLYNNWQLNLNDYKEPVFSFPGDENAADHRRIVFSEQKLNWKQIDFLRSKGFNIGVPEEIVIVEVPEKVVTLE